MSHTRFYKIWRKINSRCNDKNHHAYADYGGRGIRVTWGSYTQFFEDMYPSYLEHVAKYGEQQTSIHREDNDGDYGPNNAVWATKTVQANNRRTTHWVVVLGERMSMTELCRRYRLSPYTMWRYTGRDGLTTEEAIRRIIGKKLRDLQQRLVR